MWVNCCFSFESVVLVLKNIVFGWRDLVFGLVRARGLILLCLKIYMVCLV